MKIAIKGSSSLTPPRRSFWPGFHGPAFASPRASMTTRGARVNFGFKVQGALRGWRFVPGSALLVEMSCKSSLAYANCSLCVRSKGLQLLQRALAWLGQDILLDLSLTLWALLGIGRSKIYGERRLTCAQSEEDLKGRMQGRIDPATVAGRVQGCLKPNLRL
ncbi:hypothetical protein VNO77_02086 [Canavalia gladiata]|uniref:Uncharacterized protein n=1 Tax=Canavalia gladiata TaxID=3824 RepID=A0AAN9R2Q5_CANGL